MRTFAVYVALTVIFFVWMLIGVGILEAFDINNQRVIRLIILAGFGVCIFFRPYMKKLIIGSKYPLNKSKISHRDLKRDDIVVLENHGECKYDGYYEGYHLFVPSEKLENDETYVKLSKNEIPKLVKKVTGEYGLKWEAPSI